MNRRDVLHGLTASDERPPVRIELEPVDIEEPTWEVRQPGPRRRFDRRARTILSVAAVAALLANAGAAWAYWRFNDPDAGAGQPAAAGQRIAPQTAGTAVEILLTATSDPARALRPGETGDLTVTVTNRHPAEVRIIAIQSTGDPIVADHDRREAGCAQPRVDLTEKTFPVTWKVAPNNVGAFTVPKALMMRSGNPAACQGATFTVPVRARAVRL